MIAYANRVRDFLLFTVYALATARASTLVRDDKILNRPREWWKRKAPKGSLRATWITCIRCISISAALFPAASWVLWPEHPAALIVCTIGAFSWVAIGADLWLKLSAGKLTMFHSQDTEENADAH